MSTLLDKARAGGGEPRNMEQDGGDFAPGWKPTEPGDYAVGKVSEIREHDFGYGMTKIVALQGGEFTQGGETGDSQDVDVYLNVKVLKEETERWRVMKDDQVMYVYHGWGVSKQGRRFKKFEVEVEGRIVDEKEAF